MWGRTALLVGLSGCQLIFNVDATDSTPLPCRQQGLLVCLPFEDSIDDMFFDDHGPNGLDVELTAVATMPRDGEQALAVTAESNVVFLTNDPFDLQAPVTWDAWIFFSGVVAEERIIFDNHQQYGLGLLSNMKAACYLNVSGNLGATVDAIPDEWQHITCTFDGTDVRIYRNGGLSPNFQGRTGDIFVDPVLPRIGRAGDGTRPFEGGIDNFRIWTRLLDMDEIQRFGMGIELEAP
jgi:hypothetical protein